MNNFFDKTSSQTSKKVTKKTLWVLIVLTYTILLSFTGGVTFFYNNGFNSREENLKNLELMKSPEQFNVYKRLLKMETENMKSINNIANQSFNVVLGSLLGFLSATLTRLKSQENEVVEHQDADAESDLENS